MKTHFRYMLLAAGAVTALAAHPGAAQMQATLEPIKVTESSLRADQLDQEALGYERTDMSLWRKAGRLRKEAASLRTNDDPKLTRSLYWAARDYYYTGDESNARTLMVQSAERALAIGDVVQAATAYTEAAYISAELRDYVNAREYATKAKLLAHSLLLTESQREQLRTNLGVASLSSGLLASLETR